VKLPPGMPLRSSMRGNLLGHAFTAKLRSGVLERTMLEGRAPLQFELRSGDVRASIEGMLEALSVDRGPEIAFEFSAPHAGELASWFGFKPGAEAPAALSGKVSLHSANWSMRDILFKLGRSTLSADLTRVVSQGKPLVTVRLSAEQIDTRELESLIPTRPQKPGQSRAVLDIPILPQGIDLTDADIGVRVKRFAGTPVEVRDLSFDGRVREGYMHPSPFAVSVAGTGLSGAVTMDLRNAEPTVGLWLSAANIDVGTLLQKLGVVRDLEATFSEFAINLVARSSRLGDMLERSELLGSIGGGRIVLRDPNTRAEARIALDKGELSAAPGAQLKLTLKGDLDGVPISLALDTARAIQLADPKSPLPFKLNAEAADSSLTLTGSIARPLGSEIELALDSRGQRFDSLNKLARTSLPPWGPWSAAGKFRMSARGYEVDDLRLQIGASVLDGEGRVDTQSGRPRIDVALTSPVIQLDDFKFGEFTVKLDCDVLVADGGTRTAAITGASVAIVDAFDWMVTNGKLSTTPVKRRVAAVSVGVIDGEPRLDLDYEEDVRADVDMNVVMSSEGKFVEVQGTGEHGTFDRKQLDELLDLAISGIRALDAGQAKALAE